MKKKGKQDPKNSRRRRYPLDNVHTIRFFDAPERKLRQYK